jgi:hypothetical protein
VFHSVLRVSVPHIFDEEMTSFAFSNEFVDGSIRALFVHRSVSIVLLFAIKKKIRDKENEIRIKKKRSG